MKKVSAFKQVSEEDFKKIISSVYCWSDLLRKFGLKPGSGNNRRIKAYAQSINADTSHFSTGKLEYRKRKRRSLSEILVENSDYQNSTRLKKRLLKEIGMDPNCVICGQKPIHNGKELVMVLDHKNGNSRDHRLHNLRLVCPNCNSQLATSFGRNRAKIS